MQKLNLTDNPRLPNDKRQKQSSIQYVCSKEDFQILLEIEVIESLCVAMFRENENSIDQSGVVEVTIILPGTVDPSMHFSRNSGTLRTIKGHTKKSRELQYHVKPHRRSATCATDRCRIPHLDRKKNNGLFVENLTEGPTINVGEIVGDLPSKVTLKPQTIVSQKNMKLHHGDHRDSFISDLEIPSVEIDQQTVAADLLKSCVTFCNFESKVRGITPHINPLVYQVHLEAETTQQNHPLVELSAAQYILGTYEPSEFARWNAKHQIIEAMMKTLTKWGSDEERIADTLYQDTSSLMRCEHCGVISFKKAPILGPITRDEFSVKVDNSQQLHCEDDQKCLTTGNTESFCDVGPLNAHDQLSRNQFTENTAWSKSSTSFTKTDATKDKLKVQKPGIKKTPENFSELKFHKPYYGPDTKLLLQRPTNAESIGTQSATDTMTAERESDSVSEDMIKMINVDKKRELSAMLPLVITNKFGRCSNIEKNEKSNDTRFNNTYSARYSLRQIIAKDVKKPGQNNCRDNRNGSNFETGNNRTKIQSKNSTSPRRDYEKNKASICKNDNTDNNDANHTSAGAGTSAATTRETSLSQDLSRKNKLARSLVPPSNIPTKLVKNNSLKPSSSKNVANYSVREKPCAIDGKERTILQTNREPSIRRDGHQILVPSNNNENESQSKAELWLWKNQTLLAGGIQENSQDQCADSNNLSKNFLHRCTTFSCAKLSTDQEYIGNNQLSNSDNDQRSFRSTKNRKLDQIVPDFNYSAPLIGFARNTFGNKDLVIADRHLADDSVPAQYNGESETTAFSSSSSENVIREWATSFVQVPRTDCEPFRVKRNDQPSSDAIRNIRAQIDKAVEKCSNYSAVVSKEKLCSHKTLRKSDGSLKLDQKNLLPDIDYNIEPYIHHFSANVVTPSNNAAQTVLLRSENDRKPQGFDDSDCIVSTSISKMKGERFKITDDFKKLFLADNTGKMTAAFEESTFNALEKAQELKVVLNKCRANGNDTVYTVEEDRSKKSDWHNVNPVKNLAEEIRGVQSGIPKSQKNFGTSKGIFFGKQKYSAIETPLSKSFNKLSNDHVKMTYKNPSSVVSSSSEYSNEYRRELEVQKRSLRNGQVGSVLQPNESETFERQITYDEILSKNISTGSKESLGAKALPVYRKILESKDEMDWESFQQLVGALHPSQRELWYDICKAVSNEAKRIAGETGASTEVCIEINPIPTSQTSPCKEQISGVKTSGNEISFEMDMILPDSETFLDQKSPGSPKTLYNPEKCH